MTINFIDTVNRPSEPKSTRYNFSLGETIFLECQPNVPSYKVIWKKDEEVLKFESLKYVQLQSGDLIIYKAESKDAGEYRCTAASLYYSNSGSLPLLSKVTLSLEPPEGM